ncbi:hypothetical protein Nepgr_027792 [Nepenthes gracilis]|uniref:Protein kinase domain-containing protein n=1 Tax=Nepenthes gracilis TaxID=150966 RepID=A0AAD3Y3G4_NEPGR|nr:hypothetical protein Nepgr_027792 [Nepenthes gracilis]
MQSNKFTGPIPTSFANLTNLTYFSASFNFLTGEIPSEMGSLYNLMNLILNNNLLSGSLPPSIINCTCLLVVDVPYNKLSGKLPRGLGQLSNLTYFSVAANEIFGEIPDDLFNCSSLQTLDVGVNNFTGVVRPSIGNLIKLERFQAHRNSFTGKIPPEIGNLSSLLTLYIESNRFSGLVPPELSKLSVLQGLSLHDNALDGTIPEEIFGMKKLTTLELQNNRFNGPISASISKLEQLSVLNLAGNLFNGPIPTSMAGLSRTMILDLSHNNLTGSIPASLIAGVKSIQKYMNFSYNSFSGPIPEEIGMLDMAQGIDFSNNALSGSIPSTIKSCRNLISLDMSRNNLSGRIPDDIFADMDSLASLNLSSNQLDGDIPGSLANLLHLSSLDLSQNMLEGEIPNNLSELSSLKYLNLSFNQLEGPVPQSGIFADLPASSLAVNKALCGTKFLGPCAQKKPPKHHLSRKAQLILIPLGCASVLAILVLLTLVGKDSINKKKKKDAENSEPQYNSALTLKRFSSKDLEIAANFFDEENILGASSLSTVYKGRMEDGQIVAIKKLNLLQFKAESDKCFNREAKILSQLRHRNLVKVIGYAWESGKLKALVLEYMENGNLERIIHDFSADFSAWTLPKRIDVCVSIAEGLAYLHSGYDFPIIHCDLKPSNILLDGDWEAHVSDFGTARMLGVHLQDGSCVSSASAFEGTIGYMAPEFAYMRTVTTKVDVFSFGVIMMELLTRRRPTGLIAQDGMPITLHHLVEMALEGNNLLHVIDPALASNISEEQAVVLEELLKLALLCTSPAPEERLDINVVLASLESLLKQSKLG